MGGNDLTQAFRRGQVGCARVAGGCCLVFLAILAITGTIMLPIGLKQADTVSNMDPSTDFTLFSPSCSITGAAYGAYDDEQRVQLRMSERTGCNTNSDDDEGYSRRSYGSSSSSRGSNSNNRDCKTRMQPICVDTITWKFRTPESSQSYDAKIESNVRCEDCNCANTTRTWNGRNLDTNQTVTCWKPTVSVSALPDGYTCVNKLCYRISDPQTDKDTLADKAQGLVVGGAATLGLGTLGISILCGLFWKTSCFKNKDQHHLENKDPYYQPAMQPMQTIQPMQPMQPPMPQQYPPQYPQQYPQMQPMQRQYAQPMQQQYAQPMQQQYAQPMHPMQPMQQQHPQPYPQM